VQGLYEKSLIPVEDLLIKFNFADFIKRFERENMNIIEFGAETDYDKKINTIKEQLKAYATEIKQPEVKVEPIVTE
jgi:hypothetical protein